jgi:hypothetical protein
MSQHPDGGLRDDVEREPVLRGDAHLLTRRGLALGPVSYTQIRAHET